MSKLEAAIAAWWKKNEARVLDMEGELTDEPGFPSWLQGFMSGVYFIGARHPGCTGEDDCPGPALLAAEADGWNTCISYVKIGFAKDLYQRFHSIKSSNPLDVELLAVFDGDLADERALHDVFASVRVRREWFRYGPELEDFVQTLADHGGFCPRLEK